MTKALSFQQVILKLHEFWAAHDCLISAPYNVQVGAGTGNPATALRVLGPEPWRAAYVEPTVRPDDGRFGDNPNRMQKYYQYQVILKPDPGNPQELYLESLAALGIRQREHDIRFVEDNWESPALGAWGLGWEVWLDGQEITQFTYFQQAGGIPLDPVSVEITYGIERIVLALQGVESAWQIDWMDGIQYGDLMLSDEVEHCRYYFEVADVDALRRVYDTYEREHARALEGDALISAYDYVLKCSHLFNVLDARGAIGVAQRANYFRRMRDMTQAVAAEYVSKREQLGFPLMKMASTWSAAPQQPAPPSPAPATAPADVLIEIGVEEMPAQDAASALRQMTEATPHLFQSLRLDYASLHVQATPRRIALFARQVAPRQRDREVVAKGPPAKIAYDAEGQPTRAAIGFARSKGIDPADLQVQALDGGSYVTARLHHPGQPAIDLLSQHLPELIRSLKFDKTMRWNGSGVAFSRPLRWIVALFGGSVIPFEVAGVASGNITRGLRSHGSPAIQLGAASDYAQAMRDNQIILDVERRKGLIKRQIDYLARGIDAAVAPDDALLAEVANLVEAPTAFLGRFDAQYLELPRAVLVTVMRLHQRYFALQDAQGQLLNAFIGVRNGDDAHLHQVVRGNEGVIRARFADASFFFRADLRTPLSDFLPRLDTLTFQSRLGSMRQKNDRVASAVGGLGELLGFAPADIAIAREAAALAKADLATSMVVEMTSLQGVIGREYALRGGIKPGVAEAIYEHWLPRAAGDALPASAAGRLLSLADKLDSLVGLFAVGLAPTPTSDAYGLRRMALALIQILVDAGISADLGELIAFAAADQPVAVERPVQSRILAFILARFDNWLGDAFSYRRDVIRAVLQEQGRDPAGALRGIIELEDWTRRGDWESLLDSFARCRRITRGESPQELDPRLLAAGQEKALYDAYVIASAELSQGGGVDGFLAAFAKMTPAVTDFFDSVLVHADDRALRDNRIALLQRISALQDGRADLSELAGF